jgi:hypothetical protein
VAVALALPLLLTAAARLGRRFALRLRLLAAALVLACTSSLTLSLQALPGFPNSSRPPLTPRLPLSADFWPAASTVRSPWAFPSAALPGLMSISATPSLAIPRSSPCTWTALAAA